MDLTQLHLFITLAESRSFHTASERHAIPQSSVRDQMQALEEELGAALLLCSGQQIELTEAGTEFLGYAKQLLSTAQVAKTRLYSISHGCTGHLRVLVVQSCVEFASQCLFRFHQFYPNILIEVDVVTGAAQMNAIRFNQTDLIISSSSLIRSFPQMNCRIMYQEHYSILYRTGTIPVMSTLHPDDFSSLSSIPLICEKRIQSPFLLDQILQICRNRKLEPVNIYWCDSAASFFLALQSGLGWGLAPTSIYTGPAEGLELLPLTGEDARSDCAVGWSRNTKNQAVSLFLTLLENAGDPDE